MTYRELLDLIPVTATPGNTVAASDFVATINTFIQSGDMRAIKESNRNYVYRLREKWDKRARGLDARWNTHGCMPGRANKNRKFSAGEKYMHEARVDPLVDSIMKKYSNPTRSTGNE